MIVGRLNPTRGPYLTGYAYLPPPVDDWAEVPFLVDTGASWTTLHPVDLIKFGPNIAELNPRIASRFLLGIGGTVQPFASRGAIGFFHDDGQFTSFTLDIALVITDPPNFALPSLLGMDVLSLGVLTVDASTRLIKFDVPPGAFVLPPSE